jgi:hypothetical protein
MRHPCLRDRALGLLILLLAAGCDHNVYELLLQPQDSGMKRTLECRRVDSGAQGEVLKPMLQDELDRLAAVYGVPPDPTEARRFAFAGEFADRTPADIGGAGTYHCWRSSLGALSAYAERFRGSDDQAAAIEKRELAADRLTELLGAWLQTRLGQAKEWGQFQAFLSNVFRRDLRNLAVMAWAGHFVQDTGFVGATGSSAAASLARALLFLSEHGYLLPGELPAWGRAIRDQEGVHGSLGSLAPLIADAVARRAGLAADAEVIVALRGLLAQKTLEEEVNAWLQTTPEWRVKVAEWETRQREDPDAPMEVLSDLAFEAAGLGPGSSSEGDELRLRLALPVKPFYSNGTWDTAKREVAWQTSLPGEERTPYLAYASWAAPDETAQKQRFGRVLLRDQALADYVLWVQGLAQEEAAEWDAFVAGLRPDAALAARLAEFRFQSEADAGPATEEALAASRAQPGRKLLLDALQAPERAPATGP